eukprot:scaffold8880_cov22-Tisochrysis_lutea.AAC.1
MGNCGWAICALSKPAVNDSHKAFQMPQVVSSPGDPDTMAAWQILCKHAPFSFPDVLLGFQPGRSLE